jgi:hypothetical protein
MADPKAASAELLQAALLGYEYELASLTERIAELRRERPAVAWVRPK